jgi:hypothetical protein
MSVAQVLPLVRVYMLQREQQRALTRTITQSVSL